ncbi:TBC1 domain family member 13-like [Apostichopus japonicus]|uniref:TBC1 domain family member 13-like n=1 Tax=Stichopus japonicus TaxID=307972 RepID=UPI003AB30B9E
MASSYQKRVQLFKECLNEDNINLKTLKKLCFNGVPDSLNLRPLSWKVLLRYLPLEREQWKSEMAKQRALYRQFLEDVIIKPGKAMHGVTGEEAALTDHPLNPNPTSQWSNFFKDNDVLLQIDKDTRRLQPDLGFFQSPTEFPCHDLVLAQEMETLRHRVEHTLLISSNVEKNRTGITNVPTKARTQVTAEFGHNPCGDGQEAHWEVVERILFIYAKLNPGQGYVQGMNEIIGPLYYVFACDPESEWREHAEEDTFFCFTNLMADIRDIFIKTLDHSELGIHAKMRNLMLLLKKCEMPVWQSLKEQGLEPEFFSFRWFTLLLTQEFPLPDVIRIWDTLLADDNGTEMLLHICCAMLLLQSKELRKGDFASNMKLLQHYPPVDVHVLVQRAMEVRESVS